MFFALALVAPALLAQEAAPDPARASTVREALLLMAKRFDAGAETGPVRAQLDVYALELRDRLAGETTAEGRARAVASYFFGKPLLAPGEDLADPANFYVHRVLAGRQGCCLALSAIVLAVAEKLKLPLHAVAAPRHVFVRWDDGTTRINIETLEGGAQHDDGWYRERHVPRSAEAAGCYLRNLTLPELLAHLLNNEGYIAWRAGDSVTAKARFAQALELHPSLIEAHINLGVVDGSEGREEAAQEHFRKVLAWMPDDAPTLFNRSLAHLKSGDLGAALEDVETAARIAPRSPYLRQYRELVLSTVLRPDKWPEYQRGIVTRGEELRRTKALRPGFLGSYFRNRELEGPAARRVDPDIRFEWRWGEPHPGIPADHFSVRWEGFVDVPEDGAYTFYTVANDGVRLWVDGLRLIDDWKQNEGALDQQALTLKAGLHRVRLEYFELTAFAGITFQVKRSEGSSALPPSRYWHAP